MKVYAGAAVLFLMVAKAFAAPPEASGGGDGGGAASAPAPAEIRQQLDQTQKMLREQAEMLSAMRQELDRQGREIESLRQRLPSAAPATAPGDGGESAARLETAVLSLREPARKALVRPVIPAKVRESTQPDVKAGSWPSTSAMPPLLPAAGSTSRPICAAPMWAAESAQTSCPFPLAIRRRAASARRG